MKRPAFQFYPADWRKDSALQSTSIAARGLWIEMTCIMHECDPYGHLAVNGNPLQETQLSRLVGEPVTAVKKLLAELESAGVFSRLENGCIYSRRMVKDEHLRNVRAEAGRLGGNPNLLNQKDKQTDNHSGKQSPTPSSSSSSSLKPKAPNPAEAGPSRAIALQTYLESCKQAGAKPIPEDDPVFKYADEIALPHEFLRLQWLEFKDRYTQPGAKRYKAWTTVFGKSVRGNWFKLWYAKDDGYQLTTTGQQARALHKEKL